MFKTICYVNENQYNITLKRTYILLNNIIDTNKISYYDINNIDLHHDKLIIELSLNNNNLNITGTNIKNLHKHIISNMEKLHFDLNICNLIVNESECYCSICIDEKKKDKIIKLKCCNNRFHLKCFTAYFKSRTSYICPICRNDKIIY